MTVSENEQGFSVIELLIVIVILVVIVVVGWLVYKNHHKTTSSSVSTSVSAKTASPSNTPTNTKATINSYAGWKSYTTPEGLSFKYPTGWNLNIQDSPWLLSSVVNNNQQFVFGYSKFTNTPPYLPNDTVVSNIPLNIATAIKPLYLLTLDYDSDLGNNIAAVIVTDVNAAKGATNVNLDTGFTPLSGKGTITFYAQLGSPNAQNYGGGSLATWQNEADYSNVIKVFQSINL